MITIIKHVGSKRADVYCLSTDIKPTEYANASACYEMDTKKFFLFDEENKKWLEQ